MKIRDFANVSAGCATSALEKKLGREATAKEAADNYKKVKARAITKASGKSAGNKFRKSFDAGDYNWNRK